jgi:predicted transcriptional regulator
MKKTKYTEEQVIGAVKQLEAGRATKDVAREMGVTDQGRVGDGRGAGPTGSRPFPFAE